MYMHMQMYMSMCMTLCMYMYMCGASEVVLVVGMGGCDVKLTNSNLARTHEPRAAGRSGQVHKGEPSLSTAGSIPTPKGKDG